MQLQETEDINNGTIKKYRCSDTNPTSDQFLNIEDFSSASLEIRWAAKIKHNKRRKNTSKKFKKYFNIHEKIGQIFIAVLIISFLYTFGYFLEYWHATSL